MSDGSSTVQLSNRPITDQRPFLILPSLDSQLPHDHNSLIGPLCEYNNLHHLHQHPHTEPLPFHLPPPPMPHSTPNSSLLESFDLPFRGSSTSQAVGLLPMPVAYEAYVDEPAGAYPSSRSIDPDWDLSSPMRTQFGSAAMAHALVVPSPMHEHAQPDPPSSTPRLPMHPAPHLHSTPPLHHPPYGHPPSPFPHQLIYHASKPPTPPPLFDASEQDLLSSFLNIFGDANGECDFEPQGMPEGMPVLGALKRRLEASGPYAAEHAGWQEKRDADDMGNAVEHRLWISGPDSAPSRPRRPSLRSQTDTLPGTSDPQRDQPVASRKKPKTDAGSHLEAPAEPPVHSRKVDSEDVEMAHVLNDSAVAAPNPGSFRQPTLLELAAAVHEKEPEAPAFQGVAQSSEALKDGPSPVIIGRAGTEHAGLVRSSMGESGRECKPASKGAKSTHLVSEQRRRNAIQGGFGNLVEILRAGEAQSGISIANSGAMDGGTRDSKTTRARGRGRRGEIETGASKSVVLERAAWFVRWMERGNEALRGEVEGVENRLKGIGWKI